MKETIKEHLVCREYTSLDEFYKYICDTPLNEAFRWKTLSSVTNAKSFCGTESYEEAVQLFKNGWDSGVKQIQLALKDLPTKETQGFIQRTLYDVVGFQCSVPRYLQGIPTNMVNKKLSPVKQKVVVLNKIVNYTAGYKNYEIIKWGAETLKVIEAIERKGFRVKLNVVIANRCGGDVEVVKIPVKKPDERLNLSKLAFPLAHTSMFRRLGFRYIEVSPTVDGKWVYGYGASMDKPEVQKTFEELGFKNEIVLPKFLSDAEAIVKDITTNI